MVKKIIRLRKIKQEREKEARESRDYIFALNSIIINKLKIKKGRL